MTQVEQEIKSEGEHFGLAYRSLEPLREEWQDLFPGYTVTFMEVFPERARIHFLYSSKDYQARLKQIKDEGFFARGLELLHYICQNYPEVKLKFKMQLEPLVPYAFNERWGLEITLYNHLAFRAKGNKNNPLQTVEINYSVDQSGEQTLARIELEKI